MVNAWKWYIDFRWRDVSKIFEYEMHGHILEAAQWAEMDEIPKEMDEHLKYLCKEVIPVKTKKVELIDIILEHSIISSIQAQLLFLALPYDVCVSNSIYACFTRIRDTPVFQEMVDDYRTYWMAAKKIQFCWRRCISNPAYFMCKRRIYRDCGVLL